MIHQMGLLHHFRIPLNSDPNSNPYKLTEAVIAGKKVTLDILKELIYVTTTLLLQISIYFVLFEYPNLEHAKNLIMI